MRYHTIHAVHTFFLGNMSVENGTHPQVYFLTEIAEPRMREFLDERASNGLYTYSYYLRAFRERDTLYAVYVHFADAENAAAFRLVWDGCKDLRNY